MEPTSRHRVKAVSWITSITTPRCGMTIMPRHITRLRLSLSLVAGIVLLPYLIAAQSAENNSTPSSIYGLISSLIASPPISHEAVQPLIAEKLTLETSTSLSNKFVGGRIILSDAILNGLSFFENLPNGDAKVSRALWLFFDKKICVPRSKFEARFGPLKDTASLAADHINMSKPEPWGLLSVSLYGESRNCVGRIVFFIDKNYSPSK